MGRQATIVSLSCRKQAYESLQKRWADSGGSGLVFVVETGPIRMAGKQESDAPLYILGDSTGGLVEQFLEFARGLLLFPEPVAQDRPGLPLDMDHLQIGCGSSSLCCLRAGRVLAEFLLSRGEAGGLLILEPDDEKRSEKPGSVLARILRARNQPAGIERLTRLYPSYFFLAAGFVSGALRHSVEGQSMQDFRNRALQHSEN